jgi:hypothetical protein
VTQRGAPRPAIGTAVEVGLVVVLPLLAALAAAELDVGPVLLVVSPTHGIHALDLAIVALAAPPWCRAGARLLRRLRANGGDRT